MKMFCTPSSLFVLLLVMGAMFTGCYEVPITPVPRPNPPVIDGSGDIKLIFAGDTMFARDVEIMIQNKGGGDYGFPFNNVKDYLRQADITFVNLESIISDKGFPYFLKIPPWFRSDLEAVNGLTDAGIDIVSVANNHSFDFGPSAFEDSLNNLRNAGIQDAGGGFNYDEAYSPIIFTVKGKKVAFIAFTIIGSPLWRATKGEDESSGESGIAWLTVEDLESSIYQARDNEADIIVVSMHFGSEYHTLPNQEQEEFAHLAIDRGADFVIGHHPHVMQPVMVYAGKYIAYSLGNFVFDQKNEDTHKGFLLEATIQQDEEPTDVTQVYYTINEFYQPVFD